jgi:hypothetical protein
MMHSLHDPLNDQPNCEHVDLRLILIGLQEVNLGEVHADRLGNECLEELHHEGEGDALALGGAGRCEFLFIDTVDVERDPVGLVLLTVGEEIVIYFSLYLGDPVGMADS